jgi:hypothetical protein
MKPAQGALGYGGVVSKFCPAYANSAKSVADVGVIVFEVITVPDPVLAENLIAI